MALLESQSLYSVSTSSIVDSSGAVWTLANSSDNGVVILRNGVLEPYSANVTLLLYFNHKVFQQNAAGGWWYYNAGSWVGTTDPRKTPLPTPPAPTPTPPLPTPTPPVSSAPFFYDDFSGGLDSKKWNGSYPWYPAAGGSDPTQGGFYLNPFYAANADIKSISVVNNILEIKLYRTPAGVGSRVDNKPWIDGLLTSKASWTYGYFEARTQMTPGAGTMGAFWLYSATGTTSELDICEHVGNNVQCTIHDGGAGAGATKAVNSIGNWHTYGMDWNARTIKFYIDGQEYLSRNTSDYNKTPMYMILSVNVAPPGGSWYGSTNSSTPSPSYYRIDYVGGWKDKATRDAFFG